MAVKITCIQKDNGDHYDPHEGITALGWINESDNTQGNSTRKEIIDFIKGGGTVYVKDQYGNKVFVEVRISRFNNEYVRTVADGRETNNLLELPQCR